ncbi:MAG: prepilin-type N-terminal cleavage/methylation domain-containing protein [Nitrospirae bacterium]|nr:prepilin-type N-terminal cleavage/methylation domain-containing protein [Nitrospirota bacterium]
MEQPAPQRHRALVHPFLSGRASGARSGQAGFTLIELVIIIVIIGILAIVAIPRFNYSGPQVSATSRKLIGDLRYAQARAVATQVPHGVTFAACAGGAAGCTQYRLFFNCAGIQNNSNCAPAELAAFTGFAVTADPLGQYYLEKDPLSGQDFSMQMIGPHDGVLLDTTLAEQTIQFNATGRPCGGWGAGCVALALLPSPTNTIDVHKDMACEQMSVTVATGLVDWRDQC